MRALARQPDSRYATAGAFAEAFEEAAAALPSEPARSQRAESRSTAPSRSKRSGLPTLVEDSPGDLIEPSGSRFFPRRLPRAAPALTLLGALAAVAVGLVLLLSGEGPGGEAAALPRPLRDGRRRWRSATSTGSMDLPGWPSGSALKGRATRSFAGDAEAKTDWSQDPSQSPAKFVRSADRHGLFPYSYYYGLRALGRTGEADAEAPQMRQTLVNRRLMRIYWENVRKLMRSFGSTGKPAAVTIESGMFAELQQQLGFTGSRPESVQAIVGSSGLPELKGLPDSLLGFAEAWRALRNRYAPKVLIGVELDDYGDNIDISRDLPPPDTLAASARAIGDFYLAVAANDYDYAGLEIAYSEEGQNPSRTESTRPPRSRASSTSSAEFVRRAQIPLVLDGVPTRQHGVPGDHRQALPLARQLGAVADGRPRLLRAHRAARRRRHRRRLQRQRRARRTCPCDAAERRRDERRQVRHSVDLGRRRRRLSRRARRGAGAGRRHGAPPMSRS